MTVLARLARLTAEAAVPTGAVLHPQFLFSQEDVRGQECCEDYRDYAVHGEEGGV
jgi:hypothetical protein